MSFDVEGIERTHDAERNAEGLGDGDDAGEAAKTRFELAIESAALGFLIADLLNIEREIQNVAGIEAEIDGLRFAEAANEKSSNDEQDERAGDLSDDERAACKLTAAAIGRAAAAFVKDGIDVAAGHTKRRGDSHEYGG